MRPARLPFLFFAVALLASAAARWRTLLPVQDQPAANLAAGKLLVARRGMADPNFAQSVILLVEYGEEGTVGLVLNRQTKIPISKLSKELDVAKGRTDPLYLGGPVETSTVMALVRSRAKPDDAKLVFSDVYMVSNKETLEKTMSSGTAPSTLRLYLGYSGWDAGQLEWELGMGAWDVLAANPGMVFDPHPETLWSRLVEREQLQIARLSRVLGARFRIFPPN
jgi:putative transcriptional regulator